MTAGAPTASSGLPGAGTLDIERALDVAQAQVARLVDRNPDRVPIYTRKGRWVFDDDPWAPVWTAGFLAGEAWVFAERTGDPAWRDLAEHYSRLLEDRKLDTGTHDIGFLFTPSWGRWHALAPCDRTRDVLVQAGRTMAARYNPHGCYLSSWVDPGSTFIDIMMNIGIIFQAAELRGDSALADVAFRHALTTRRFLVRGDASTVHEGWFDPESGQFLHAATHQGYRPDSCWARGLAWAMYGFGTAWLFTRDRRFLATAEALAGTWIDRTGRRFVPPNDWDDPDPVTPYEASAACVAASALLQLAPLAGEHGRTYAGYAARILATLASEDFMADASGAWKGIIRHAIYHYGNRLGVDESVMWGDYYFIEALWRLASSADLRRLAGWKEIP